jgi:carboxymethylenebutenolidase
VLVVHDWYGLLPHVRGWCDRLAGEGFVALAPDLYEGASTTDAARAEALMDALRADDARRRLGAATAFLRAHPRLDPGRVGAVGFSMGGMLMLEAATTGAFDAVVAYYAALDAAGPAIASPMLVHTAEVDDWDPPDAPERFVAALRAAGSEAEGRAWPGT